jgi:ABC-type branched-subunit amino acid transport system ATPase component
LATADPIALRIEGLHVHYGLSHVLQGVSLDVPTGQVTAIVGRNGVGKTTLVNTIMGMLPQTEGKVLVRGENLLDHPAFDRKRFGLALVPQGRRLFGSLTVEEHLHLVRPIAESPYDAEAIWELFPSLNKRRRALARTLSGGERSMLSVARALILNPTILLMDEPTEGLAPLLVDTIRDVVLSMREQSLTLLLVEQKLPFALATGDRIAVMERGAIAGIYEQGEIDDVEALSQLILHGEGGG